jgi:hypothetical protein
MGDGGLAMADQLPVSMSGAPPAGRSPHLVVSASALNSNFKMIFIAVCLLAVLLLTIRIGLSVLIAEPKNESVKESIISCGLLSNACFGAILGLLGGKYSDSLSARQ